MFYSSRTNETIINLIIALNQIKMLGSDSLCGAKRDLSLIESVTEVICTIIGQLDSCAINRIPTTSNQMGYVYR